jgi:hypothetical protein
MTTKPHDGRPSKALAVAAKPASAPRGRLAAWSEAVRRQTREHPGRTVALTLGTGFILGGGLFSPLTARLLGVGLRLGLRLLVLPMVAEGLLAWGGGPLARGDTSASVGGSTEPRPETKRRRHAHEAQ